MNAAFVLLTASLLGHPGCGCDTCAPAPAVSCDSCCHVSFFDRFRGVFAGHCNTCAPTCAPVCEVCKPACITPVCNTCDTCSSCGHWSWKPGMFTGLFHRSGCGCETPCAPACDTCSSCSAPACSTCGSAYAAPVVVAPGAPMTPATPATQAPAPTKMPATPATKAPAVAPPAVAPPPAKAPPTKGVNLQIESSPAPLAVPTYAPTIENRPQQPGEVVPNSLRNPF